MSKKLLIICPSRGRPERLKTMLESFEDTRTGDTSLIVYVSEDDKCLDSYKQVLIDKPHIIGKRRYITDVFNYCSSRFNKFDYYGEVNDDHIYRTKGWDEKLVGVIEASGGVGIAFGNDVLHDQDKSHMLPSALIMSGNIVRALGYMAHPSFKHVYVDNFFQDIGQGIDRFFKVPEVVIEHKHFLSGTVESDDNYKYVLSQETLQEGKQIYLNWCSEQRQKDIDKIKAMM